MVYKVAFQRADREIETLYWNGSLEETVGLARSVAFAVTAAVRKYFRNDYLRRSVVELGLSEAIPEGGISRMRRGRLQPSS
jgi:hypothetical protein